MHLLGSSVQFSFSILPHGIDGFACVQMSYESVVGKFSVMVAICGALRKDLALVRSRARLRVREVVLKCFDVGPLTEIEM